jgi:hypothetical protein
VSFIAALALPSRGLVVSTFKGIVYSVFKCRHQGDLIMFDSRYRKLLDLAHCHAETFGALPSLYKLKAKTVSYREGDRVLDRHHSDGGYCGVIALATTARIAVGRARALLAKYADRKHRKGTPQLAHFTLLLRMGYTLEEYPVKSKTLKTIQKELANVEGSFYISTSGHISCMHNGTMNDWANNAIRPCNKRILFVVKISPTDKVVRY